MDAKFREILVRRFIDPLAILMAQEHEIIAKGGGCDPDGMTYIFADLFFDAFREAGALKIDAGNMAEYAGISDGFADKFAGYLNPLECKMAVRSLLKGKTIYNVFPVGGYYGEGVKEIAS